MNNNGVFSELILITVNASDLEDTYLIGHSEPVSSAYFSADEQLGLSCTKDWMLLIWMPGGHLYTEIIWKMKSSSPQNGTISYEG